ncbi:hypothetical protein [Vulcanisaeta distributa]|uniref:hypothetical protein n=1 Tax=Vulcanisaeta distributa TaxID=164451 RepID=UPI001FB39F23|nr:hypothetical protein [Vulcanisaeta distributa]
MSERVNITISVPKRLKDDVDVVKDYFRIRYGGERLTWERIIRAGVDALLIQRGLNLERVRREVEDLERAVREVTSG